MRWADLDNGCAMPAEREDVRSAGLQRRGTPRPVTAGGAVPAAREQGRPCARPPLAADLPSWAQRVNAALDALGGRVVLFRYADLVFVSFGSFAALGALLSLTAMGVVLVGQGLDPRLFLGFAAGGSAAVVAGSWLLGQALDSHLIRQNPRAALRRPVFVSWGGLLGMPVAVGLFASLSGFDCLLLWDALACAVPLGHAVGRLGCLSYGCCFGRPTHGPLAITYRNPMAKAVRVAGLGGVRLHPAALYEAVLDVAIAGAVAAVVALDAPAGVPAAVAALCYGLGRFAIEFTRNNDGRIVLGCLSVNHIVSLVLASVGGLALPWLPPFSHPAPAFSWAAAGAAIPWLSLAVVPGALLFFIGFSVHRRRVGEW